MPLIKQWKNPDKSTFQEFGQKLSKGLLGFFENTHLETLGKIPTKFCWKLGKFEAYTLSIQGILR